MYGTFVMPDGAKAYSKSNRRYVIFSRLPNGHWRPVARSDSLFTAQRRWTRGGVLVDTKTGEVRG